jgi:choloylglycine hydrolase
MKKYFFVCALIVFSFTLVSASSLACSDFRIKAKDGTVVIGRSMEFPINLKSGITVYPRGLNYASVDEKGVKGLSWTTKYGFIALNAYGDPSMTSDGFNEKGLTFDGLMYTDAVYEPSTPGKFITIADFGAWVMGNFATVDEVKAALPEINVAEIKNKEFKNGLGLHIAIHDKSGKSLVVEFINGKKQIYDNPLGVMTNRPDFPWQLDNLRNYVNLDSTDVDSKTINGVKFSSTGVGSGLKGIPGDWTPPSRFVKIAFSVDAAVKPKDAAEAVNLAEHILNAVDIPKGAITEKINPFITIYGIAQWSLVKDLTNQILYFRTYEDMALKSVDLKKCNLAIGQKIKQFPISKTNQPTIDLTDRLN